MEPLCAYENQKCVNFGFDDWPVIELVEFDGLWSKDVTHMLILYVMYGRMDVSFGTVRDYRLTEGDIMLFPPGIRLSARTTDMSPAGFMLFKVKNRIVLCDKFVFGDIGRNLDVSSLRHTHLAACPTVRAYMEMLAGHISGRMQCYRFMDVKITELFHYLRAYYTPEELAGFTLPIMSSNAQFMHFIWNNYRKVHNVNQFAQVANCSLSAFKAKFKTVTGMAPSQWLREQKARNVFHEISCGNKSLKEISEEYHFSSVSHLGTFCRKSFGKSPGSLKPGRKKSESTQIRQLSGPI